MPWLRVDDGLPFDAKVLTLGRTKAEQNETLGMAVRLWAWCAQQRTDGFLPAGIVDMVGTPACLKRLLTASFGRKALLHKRGEQCECLRERRWPDGADYLVHDFLDRNPSRAENDVARAQKRELRDRELRAAVRARDGDRCRYCGTQVNWSDRRSGRGGVLDHVVPDVAAGADNLVVACRACNTRKGHRTPEAAGMRLLPLPGGRGDQRPIYDESATDPDPTAERTGNGPGTEQRTDSEPVPDPPPPRTPATRAATSPNGAAPHQRALTAQIRDGDSDPTRGAGTDRPGRVGSGNGDLDRTVGYAGPTGTRPTVGPPRTPRATDHPNPYLRQAFTGPTPEQHAGYPPEETTSP